MISCKYAKSNISPKDACIPKKLNMHFVYGIQQIRCLLVAGKQTDKICIMRSVRLNQNFEK